MFEDAIYPSADHLQNPYPLYSWLRKSAPVYQVPGRGEYLISRHEDVSRVLDNPELFSSAFPRQPEKVGRPADVLESDPPAHADQKRFVMTGLKPGRVRGHAEDITQIVTDLVQASARHRQIAFVEEIAAPLPVQVFGAVFGLSPQELWRVHSTAPYVGPARRYLPEAEREGDLRRAFAMFDYLGEQLQRRTEHPTDDLLSEMIASWAGRDGGLDLAYVQSEVDILFIGGLTTTPHLLVNALLLLLQHPDVMARVRADVSLIPRVLDETLRLESPVQWQPRVATADTEIAGVAIPRGSRVLVVLGSANRDDRVFRDPASFDIDRADLKEHVGLGHGTHFCVGAPLARLETRITLEVMFSAFTEIRLSDRNDFAPYPGLSSHSLQELYLDVEPSGQS